ncbi:MAG: amidohydrolase family protein [Candidatus Cyclobacteriaceae bacterium M2_1C_046]
MKNILSIIIIFSLTITALWAQSKGETGTFALTNATINTITNGTIENGTLIIKDGKIDAIGTNLSVPADAKVIDCAGLEIYPGMIDSGTRLGLTEIGSVARTQDYNEVGEVIPHMRALTAVNPNSVLIPVTRVSGVTTVLTVPAGGLFSGTAALINLHGYTPQQMYAGFSAVVMNFPSAGRRGWWDRRTDEEVEKATKEAIKKLGDVWEKVKQYHKIDSAVAAGNTSVELDYYPEMEALLPVYRDKEPLLIEVDKANDIKAAIEWVKERGINAIFTGVSEGWRVADELAEAKIPVIVGPVLSIPAKEYYRFSRAYENPGIMKKAGVKVAIRTMESENVRNLPYNAGFAAAYGMTKEEALEAITIVPAEIFNVSDKLGSLEKGKQATLFIADGDPFETSTDVKHVFIDGWKIPMESRHTRLYEEFLNREPGLKGQ